MNWWNDINKCLEFFWGILKYKKIVKDIRAKQCPHCGVVQYKITFEKPTKFSEEIQGGGFQILTPSMIRERLERISSEDLNLLGFDSDAARPEWMILQVSLHSEKRKKNQEPELG